MSRKGAKSRTSGLNLRSTRTKATAYDARIDGLEKKLAEALEQQTATAEVLSVISSSPGKLEPVFQAMLTNAVRICDAKFGQIVPPRRRCFPSGCYSQCAACVRRGTQPRSIASTAARCAPWACRHREGGGPDRRPHDNAVLHRARSICRLRSRSRRVSGCARGPNAQGERADWCDRYLPTGSPAIHRQADRIGHKFRHAGCHRH